MIRNKLLLLGMLFVFPSFAFSQDTEKGLIEIRGTVTAFMEMALSNVSVSARKARTSTLTDTLGNFVIQAKEKDVLRFRAAGFKNNSINVNRDTDSVLVNMVFVQGEKNQRVAVGYGHIPERELAFAVVHYQSRNNDYLKYRDLPTLFQAELPGAQVGFDDGVRIYFRGSQHILNRSVTDNTGAALYVVDGMILERVDHLNVSDIASITALRGSEAAMYGTQGANGVILITTVSALH